ncbi:sugar transferase [Crocinitomix sp.]|nr:sugar transferase [Crocinitomix sp.]
MTVFKSIDSYIKYHQSNIGKFKSILTIGTGGTSSLNSEKFDLIINHHEVNRSRKISSGIRKLNEQLNVGGVLIGCVQTHKQMRESSLANKIPIIRTLYTLFGFIFHRIFPKIKGLKNVYYFITRGKNRRLTKAEVLGRIVCYGFEIIDFQDNIEGKLFFVVKKIKLVQTNQKSSYGPLYKMPRIGKNGEMIHVYKFRTMHPYSEYLQDFVLKQNGYSETGKPANDFRLTSWGKVLRKYWIDELPQLINVFRGDMKIVGVRPVSLRYFEDIPPRIQNLRMGQKPGCIPPYVAFNKRSAKEDVLFAEEIYLRLSKIHKTRVDTSLMYMAVKNIIFKGVRSA